jgi:hypothetical protein
MSCYDEIKSGPDEVSPPNRYPSVVRDGNNVREIAENSPDFALHVKPRMKMGREQDWRKED